MADRGKPAGYIEVADRMVTLYEKHPDARVQSDYRVEFVGEQSFVVAVTRVWKSPEDPMPSTGMAWEPVPGKTPFTRDSELMNAETSAWGRALVAAGIADAKEGIASANEVRNRAGGDGGENGREPPSGGPPPSPPTKASGTAVTAFKAQVRKLADERGWDADVVRHDVVRAATAGRTESTADLYESDMPALRRAFAAVTRGEDPTDAERARDRAGRPGEPASRG